MKFCPDRLIQVRTSLNINKAEAARRLNISAMAYGRYESGKREPSYSSVNYIAQTFNCNIDYLYGISDEMKADYIMISSNDSDTYSLFEIVSNNNHITKALLAYAKNLIAEEKDIKE